MHMLHPSSAVADSSCTAHRAPNARNTRSMNLLAYSDSEPDSDGDAPPAPKPALKQAPKPSFQRVVDRAHPGKIKVSLPGAAQPRAGRDDIDADAPPAKKPRLGGASAFGGLNAFLPAPKKPAVAASTSAASGKRGLGRALVAGVNLKTGAEPAFRREARAEADEYDERGNPVKKEPMNKEDFRALLHLPAPRTDTSPDAAKDAPPDTSQPQPDAAPKPAAPRFVPMSVGKGGKKKKTAAPRPAVAQSHDSNAHLSATPLAQPTAPAPTPRRPKVSLFGVAHDSDAPLSAPSGAAYQPMLYGQEDEDNAPVPDDAFDAQLAPHTTQQAAVGSSTAAPNGLTDMASELKLSAAERRQLFGKKGREADFSSARIVEFNTDTEYAHNEMLRQQGEQVQHNALKSISGTGKNSLKSLISAASTQKDALEEHFASGYRNKKEAGNKYGW
jgi:hypothetical protein